MNSCQTPFFEKVPRWDSCARIYQNQPVVSGSAMAKNRRSTLLPLVGYPEALVNQVRQLAQQQTDPQIARTLNREGLRSAKARAFTASMVAWVRSKHRIPAPARQHPGELTVRQLGQKFAVSRTSLSKQHLEPPAIRVRKHRF